MLMTLGAEKLVLGYLRDQRLVDRCPRRRAHRIDPVRARPHHDKIERLRGEGTI